jgi:hypothetical protein
VVAFFQEVIDSLSRDVERQAEELERLSPSLRSERCGNLIESLEHFMHFVSDMVRGSRHIPNSFFHLMELMQESLPEDWRFSYLIWNAPYLATFDANRFIGELLAPFIRVRELIDSGEHSWVFRVPPSIIKEPLNWPLVAHEVGHVLEQTQVKAIVSVHGPRPSNRELILDPWSTVSMKFLHSEEFQADFIASYLFGPSFEERLVSNYFTQEISLSPTHPSWENRIKVLHEYGLDLLPGKGKYEEIIRPYVDRIRDQLAAITTVSSDFANPKDVLGKTAEALNGRLTPFDCTCRGLDESRLRLGLFLPYTADYRCLLNAAILCINEAMKTYREEDFRSGRDEREYRYLVEDCVRLCHLRIHYTRRAEEQRIVSEALADDVPT